MAHPQIATFARLAEENSIPKRVLSGQMTRLSRTMHDIRYDPVNDEMLVTNPFAQAVLVFKGDAKDEDPPVRIIQGPKTQLDSPDRLDVDWVNNEIFVPEGDVIRVYPRTANGDVAPLRIIEGPDTQLRSADAVAVDTVHNVIVAGMQDRRMQWGGGGFAVFNRTDQGNVKPKGLIRGPKTEIVRITQVQVYPEKGWIIGAQSGRGDEHEPKNTFIGVWHVTDNGDVPPRWKVGGPETGMKKPRGIVLVPKHKEIIVSDMRANAIMTYYFPEMF